MLRPLFGVNAGVPSSPWARDLATGRTPAVRHLADALRSWHDHVLSPHWPSLQAVVSTELGNRAWQLGTQGAEATLNSLPPPSGGETASSRSTARSPPTSTWPGVD